MQRYLLFLAILPAAIIIWYIYRKDPVEKEPIPFLRRLFLFGVATIAGVVVFEIIAELLIGVTFGSGSPLFYLFENFLGVALIEEGAKFLVLHAEAWKSKYFNYEFDAIVYAVVISMGFATLENILYVLPSSIDVAILRGVLSVPSHAIDAVLMGYFYGRAKKADIEGNASVRTKNLVLSLVVPVLVHGAYDYLLTTEMVGSFFWLVVGSTIIALRLIRKLALEAAVL